MKEIIRERKKYYLYYTIMYAVVMLVVFFPFLLNGKTFIADNDTIAQHYPYMVKIRDFYRYNIKALITGNQLKYIDFNTFFGLDIIQTYNYYGYGNPLFLLLVFVPKNMMPFMYQAMVLLVIYLGGLFFSGYCFYHNIDKKIVLFCSMLYITSPLAIATMDQFCFVILLYQIPMAFWGLDKIIDSNSKNLFICSIAVSALSGFYLLYMVSVCLIIYYFYRIIRNRKKENQKNVMKKMIYALWCYVVAILLVAPVFFVNIYGFFKSFRNGKNNKVNLLLYSIDFYKDEILSIFLYIPGLFFTINIVVFIVLYLMIKYKEKLKLIEVSLIILLSQLSFVGLVFNGFSYPINRWFMIMSFYFCVMIALFFNKYSIGRRKIFCLFVVALIQPILFSNLFAGASECFGISNIRSISNKITYNKDTSRMDLRGGCLNRENMYCKTESAWIYTSILPKILCDGMLEFGNKCLNSTNEIYGLDLRPELETIFNIEEYYTADASVVPEYFEKKKSGNTYIYKYILPLGYTYKKTIGKKKVDKFNPIEKSWIAMKNGIVDDDGTDDLKSETKIVKRIPHSFIQKKDGYILSFDSLIDSQLYMTIDISEGIGLAGEIYNKEDIINSFSFYSKDIPWYVQRDKVYINAGYYDKISEIFLKTSGKVDINKIELYSVNMDGYSDMVKELSEYHLEGVKYETNLVEGSINLNEDRTMCISIPNIEGWNAYIDGEKTNIKTINYMFIGLDIPKGNHKIVLRYRTPWFYESCILSGITFILLIIVGIIKRIRRISV